MNTAVNNCKTYVAAAMDFVNANAYAYAGTKLAAVLLRPEQAIGARRWLERLGLAALYLGLLAWLLLRVFAN